jgi:hypothetical protein
MEALFGRALRRLKREGRDLVELVLLPGLAALLPWSLCFRIFRYAAGTFRWLYSAQCNEALQQAQCFGWLGADPSQWLMERRLVTLLDHADHYLFRTRSSAWISAHVDVHGAWQGQGRAGFLWTFHWGMGMWALLHARMNGMRAPMVLAAPQGPDFKGRTVFGRYVRARMRSVEMALGQPIIFVPGGMSGVRDALTDGKQVVVVMDVPQDQVSVTRQTTILGLPVSVPAVLPQYAIENNIPVSVFYMGIDLVSGRRELCIHQMDSKNDVGNLTDDVFLHFDRILRERPAAWHFWGQASRFFVARN